MDATAVIFSGPKDLALDALALNAPASNDVVVQVHYSGISTGTEKLLWNGSMPPFPGMGYPLVPGYEATGEIVEAGADSKLKPGARVFVPGANCFKGARGLFGAAANRLVSAADRLVEVDGAMGPEAALLALAATARHALHAPGAAFPDLIVGHGTLGRLLARLTIAQGAEPPQVWEVDAARAGGAAGYHVCHPDFDDRRDYRCVYDATGDTAVLDLLIGRLAKGGEIVLAGFYPGTVNFAFAPAFMKEARFRIAAEWSRDDLLATRQLVDAGRLSLAGLITHTSAPADAREAYPLCFNDRNCLKMILDWRFSE